MIERDYRARFLLKPLQPVRIPRKAHWQKFERRFAARGHVGGQINFPHPAAADSFGNFVVTKRLTHEQVSLLTLNNSCRNANS